MTTTQRAKKYLERDLGFRTWRVDKWIPQCKKFLDLFNFGDIIAMRHHGPLGEIYAVQVTSGANHAARKKKILENNDALYWLRSGGKIMILSFRKSTKKGQRGKYIVRRDDIYEEDFGNSDSVRA